MKNEVTLVTFFYNIKRDQWNTFNRNVDNYVNAFIEFMKFKYRMLVYIDDTLYNRLSLELEKYPDANIELFPINEDWLKENIWAWSKLDREREIMRDPNYINRIANRVAMGYPENTIPEYSILTHSKIDVINYAIEHDTEDYDYYMWVDFGYFYNKTAPIFMPVEGIIDLDKLSKDTVNICCVNKIDDRDMDIDYTLMYAPEKIGAYLFFGNKKNLKEFQQLCHKWLEHFQSINIADDEQHLWLQCYFEKPELFTEYAFGRWHMGLKYFSK